jgi:AcrR family transcriptional regulator
MPAEPSIDRRIVRTKVAIREALVSLIDEKGFDALSVKDITTQADINRGTFYLHYKDKFDLLEQTEADIVQEVASIILQANSLSLADFHRTQQPLPVMVKMFEYFQENASLVRAILGIKGDIAFQIQLRKAIEMNLSKVGFFEGINSQNFLLPSEYIITYVIAAHLGVVQMWLRKGCVESPQEMALILSKLSLDGPFRAVGIV